MNEITTEEKLDKIAKQSKNIYYSTQLFDKTKSEDEKPKIFPKELIINEEGNEQRIWAVILKYKTSEGIPQEVIMGTIGDIEDRKDKAIEIINYIKEQLEQNVTEEIFGYESYEKMCQYITRNNVPFKLTIEGKNILFVKDKENVQIQRTCYENSRGRIDSLFDKYNLEQMTREKNSEFNEYIKEIRTIQKWKERKEKILKSFDTQEKRQKFLQGENVTEFLKKIDKDIEKQKDITANYLLEAYDINQTEEKNPKLKVLNGYLAIKEKGIAIDVKKILENLESQYYNKIQEKEGEITLDEYNELEKIEDYKTFFDLVKTGKDWNARVFALKLKKIDFNNLKKLVQYANKDDKELLQYIDLKEIMINEAQTDTIELNYYKYDSLKELNSFLVKSSIRTNTKEDDERIIYGMYEHIKREIIESNYKEVDFYNYYAEKSGIKVYNTPQKKENIREKSTSETIRKICEYINTEEKTKDLDDSEELEK